MRKLKHARIVFEANTPAGVWKTIWYSIEYRCEGCQSHCEGAHPFDKIELKEELLQKLHSRLQKCARKHNAKLKIHYRTVNFLQQPTIQDFFQKT